MKVLITGGGGFLGSVVADKLKLLYDVSCLDHGKNYQFLNKYFNNKIKLIKGEISDKKLLRTVFKNVDVVIHLAGIAGERRCTQDPLKSMISNLYSTYTIVDVAKSFNVKKIIFSSSYWVYSSYLERKMPLAEDVELKTDSIYGSQKVISELIIKDSKIPFNILRISALYGYGTGIGSQWEGVIGNFIQSAFSKQPLIIYGDGEQKIDLIYVDDVAEAIKRLINAGTKNEIFNIGSGYPTSVRDVVKIITKIFKKEYNQPVKIRNIQAPPGKIWPDKWLSIKKIKSVFNNYPFTSLDEGLQKTIGGFKPHFKK